MVQPIQRITTAYDGCGEPCCHGELGGIPHSPAHYQRVLRDGNKREVVVRDANGDEHEATAIDEFWCCPVCGPEWQFKTTRVFGWKVQPI